MVSSKQTCYAYIYRISSLRLLSFLSTMYVWFAPLTINNLLVFPSSSAWGTSADSEFIQSKRYSTVNGSSSHPYPPNTPANPPPLLQRMTNCSRCFSSCCLDCIRGIEARVRADEFPRFVPAGIEHRSKSEVSSMRRDLLMSNSFKPPFTECYYCEETYCVEGCKLAGKQKEFDG